MPSRRAVIATSSIFVTGCARNPVPDFSSTPDLNEHVPDEWHEKPAKGLASPVEATIDLEDEVEYYPDKEAVRITSDEYRPADEFLASRCPFIARRPVTQQVEQRLNDPEGVGEVGVRADERELHVYRKIVLDREGDVISSPDVEFETVRKATPEHSIPTVTLGEFEHTCRLSVFVQDLLVQYD